ncbi:15299_t:CDS:2, partial [Funneliformis caledonium]
MLKGTFNKFDLMHNEKSIYINYQRNTLKDILTVCNKWFKSHEKYKKWRDFRGYSFRNQEKHGLFYDISELLPAFYYIGFEQNFDLTFGSDYAEKKLVYDPIRVLRASYTNDRNLVFEDEQDEEIARLIHNDH